VYHQWAPDRPWRVAQAEEDVLFLHYEVDPTVVRRLVPPVFDLQLVGDAAWVGILSLTMADVRFRVVPFRLPAAVRQFPEVDVVTYVTYAGRRGIYFLSIESARRWLSPPVRWLTGLPYLYSGLRIDAEGGVVRVTAGPRPSQGAATAMFDVAYEPRATIDPPVRGSPVHALVDQLSAFVIDPFGQVCELDEVHEPWSLVEANVEIRANTLGLACGIDLDDRPKLAHYARERRILSWPGKVVRPGRPGLAPVSPRD